MANSVNTCARCLQSRHDITAELERQIVIIQCKRCDRWQKEDATWTKADPDSRELLTFCLRRIKNLKFLRLIDATFVWTEPHSKRVKLKLKVQKEVEKEVVLQQSIVIEFIVQNKMCLDCHRSEASLTWDSVVQVRQAVTHKRTFLYLEQVILKHNAQERAVRIDPQPEGVDFYFGSKSDGARFTSFLDATVPIRSKQSEKLITSDVKSNNSTYNYTFSVEIAPICKDDVVVLPKTLASHLGSISRLCLCLNVGSVIRLIDPFTTRFCEISSTAYWQNPFKAILDASRLSIFVVLDVMRVDDDEQVRKPAPNMMVLDHHDKDEDGDDHERNDNDQDEGGEEEEEHRSQEGTETQKAKQRKRRRKTVAKKFSASARLSSKHTLCEVEVAKEKDFGSNDERHIVRCHLGFVLKPGDYALGYDMRTCNFNHQEEQDGKPIEFPDIILVRKHYPRVSRFERKWKLRSIAAEAPNQPGLGVGVRGDGDGTNARDMEMFLRDLEEDEEMREKVNLYQKKKRTNNNKKGAEESSAEPVKTGDWPPEVPLEQLLTDMHIGDDDDDDDVDPMNEEEEEEESNDDDASL